MKKSAKFEKPKPYQSGLSFFIPIIPDEPDWRFRAKENRDKTGHRRSDHDSRRDSPSRKSSENLRDGKSDAITGGRNNSQ